MTNQVQLEVITPERRVLAEPVDTVTIPGSGGEFGVLPGHTPLISLLQTGVLAYVQEGMSHRLHVSGGFVEVNADHVAVLADIAERPEEIDAERARRDREHAEAILRSFNGTEEELAEAHKLLDQSLARLQLVADVSAAIMR